MSSLSYRRYHCQKYQPSGEEIKAPHIKFTIDDTTKKLIGISTREGESFRSFAYFSDSIEPAKRAILMEYKMRSFS